MGVILKTQKVNLHTANYGLDDLYCWSELGSCEDCEFRELVWNVTEPICGVTLSFNKIRYKTVAEKN